jgi:hypothetical protein
MISRTHGWSSRQRALKRERVPITFNIIIISTRRPTTTRTRLFQRMILGPIFTFIGGALGLVGIGYDIWIVRNLRDDFKTKMDAIKAITSRTDAHYAALLEERRLLAEASRRADERYVEDSKRFFSLLEEVKDIKRKAWW